MYTYICSLLDTVPILPILVTTDYEVSSLCSSPCLLFEFTLGSVLGDSLLQHLTRRYRSPSFSTLLMLLRDHL